MRPSIQPEVIDRALNGDEPPQSTIRRRPSGFRRRTLLGQTLLELRVDASTKATLYVPVSDQMAQTLDQMARSLVQGF